MKKKFINEYESMRVVLTILVIISHCQYYRILTPYGGVDFLESQTTGLVAFRLLNWVWKMIYSFHMAAFIALSGALFRRSFARRKNLSLPTLTTAKAKRLLIPFAVVTLIYVFPLKLASGYWSSSSDLPGDVAIGQLLLQGNTHLWFLPTLFFAFIAVFLLKKTPLPDPAIFSLLLAAHVVSYFIPINVFSYIFEYTVWFFTGFMFEEHREKVNRSNIRRNVVIATVIFLAVFIMKMRFGSMLVRIPAGILLALLGMYITYVISLSLSKTKIRHTWLYKGILRNSFGLYLYSDPINYVLLAICAACFGNFAFTTNAGVVIMFLLRFGVTLTGAYRVSESVRRLKIKYLV